MDHQRKSRVKLLCAAVVCGALLASFCGCTTNARLAQDKENEPVTPDNTIVVPVETPQTTPEPEPATDSDLEAPTELVTDVYSLVLGDGTSFRIPQVNLPDGLADDFNAMIYNKFYGRLETEVLPFIDEGGSIPMEMVYAWGQKDELLSIVIRVGDTATPMAEFFVYTISTETGEEVDDSELYDSFGITEDEFYSQVETAMQDYFDANMNLENPEVDRIYEQTLAEENVRETRPYINDKGELCLVARIYSYADADSYLCRLTLEGEEENSYAWENDAGTAM